MAWPAADQVDDLKRRFDAQLRAAAHRARRQGLPFNLDQYRDLLWARWQRMRCELSGVELELSDGPPGPLTPSLDRRVPELGYVYHNVRVVAWGLNAAMGTWGEQPTLRLMRAWLQRTQPAQQEETTP